MSIKLKLIHCDDYEEMSTKNDDDRLMSATFEFIGTEILFYHHKKLHRYECVSSAIELYDLSIYSDLEFESYRTFSSLLFCLEINEAEPGQVFYSYLKNAIIESSLSEEDKEEMLDCFEYEVKNSIEINKSGLILSVLDKFKSLNYEYDVLQACHTFLRYETNFYHLLQKKLGD